MGRRQGAVAIVQDVALDLVGLPEIARRLNRHHVTVKAWHSSGTMPTPEAVVANRVPVWRWAVIEKWARSTGRLPESE